MPLYQEIEHCQLPKDPIITFLITYLFPLEEDAILNYIETTSLLFIRAVFSKQASPNIIVLMFSFLSYV